MAGHYLIKSRHGTVLYFRRRVPDDLRATLGKPYLVTSLGTANRRDAIILARAVAARTDILFANLRHCGENQTMPRVELKVLLDYHDNGEVKSLNVETEHPDEVIHVADVIKAARQRTSPATLASKGSNSKPVSELWTEYKAEKIATGSWKDGEDTAKYDHWPHVREFINVVGDKPVATITAEDVRKFQTKVLADPKGGSARNRDKRLTRAGALLKWAKGKRFIEDDFAELFRYPGNIPKNNYVKFDQKDLVALFESDEYRERRFKTPHEYWLPILALHTGARLNELCQLRTSDVGTYEGVATIAITDDDIGKRLKTAASRRIIPLHSTLIDLGFLEFVASIPAERIFHELPDNPARPGDYGKEPSRKFTKYRRERGVGAASERSNKTFHSFRSTLIDALRKAEVPKDRRTRLAGHEYEDTQDRNYDGGDVLTMFDYSTLKADIERVRFDIDFTPYTRSTAQSE